MLTRWPDSFRELERFQNQLNRVFNEAPAYVRGENEGISAAWIPPVDIHETPDKLVFNVEVPGFKENELTLHAENGILTIEGERKFEEKKSEKNFHRVERSYGRFARSFTLPSNVSMQDIKATLQEGVLSIDLAKREDAKPKSIPIMAAQKQMGATAVPAEKKAVREPELVGTHR